MNMYIQYVICCPNRATRRRIKEMLPDVDQGMYFDETNSGGGVWRESYINALVEEVASTRDALVRRKQIDALLASVKLRDRNMGWVFRFHKDAAPVDKFNFRGYGLGC